MWGRLGPRFALEAAFLILLAVGLGLADQEWPVIVALMAGGWALVSVIELIASRRPPWPAAARPGVIEEPPAPPPEAAPAAEAVGPDEPVPSEAGGAPPEPVAADVGELPPEPEPVAEGESVPMQEEPLPEFPPAIEPEPAPELPAQVEPEPAPELPPEPEPAPEPAVGEETQEVLLAESASEPQPRRRRWFRRRTEERAEIPEPPKHVRRLEPEQPAETRAGADSGEEHS
jgi:protein TonB